VHAKALIGRLAALSKEGLPSAAGPKIAATLSRELRFAA